MNNPLQRFWTLLSLLEWKDKHDEVLSKYGVSSFKELGPDHQYKLVTDLQSQWNEKIKRPRGAVIHYLCIMPNYNYQTEFGKPDYEKINAWVTSKMGKDLNKLNMSELNKCVTMVKQWYAKETKKI